MRLAGLQEQPLVLVSQVGRLSLQLLGDFRVQAGFGEPALDAAPLLEHPRGALSIRHDDPSATEMDSIAARAQTVQAPASQACAGSVVIRHARPGPGPAITLR
jgi:hypothetical protein